MSNTDNKYYYGVGRRKTSTARAKYYPTAQDLEITVNKRKVTEYFNNYFYQTLAEAISNLGTKTGKLDFFIKGGGTTGQVEAARLAFAKALVVFNLEMKPLIRSHGYLTTDIRKVLPKRPGLRKARKREQWSKR